MTAQQEDSGTVTCSTMAPATLTTNLLNPVSLSPVDTNRLAGAGRVVGNIKVPRGKVLLNTPISGSNSPQMLVQPRYIQCPPIITIQKEERSERVITPKGRFSSLLLLSAVAFCGLALTVGAVSPALKDRFLEPAKVQAFNGPTITIPVSSFIDNYHRNSSFDLKKLLKESSSVLNERKTPSRESKKEPSIAPVLVKKQDAPIRQEKTVSAQLVRDHVLNIITKYGKKGVNAGKLADAIIRESARQHYDPLFVAAVIKSESAFDTFAKSQVGARGLMQIMPATGKYVSEFDSLANIPKGSLTDLGYNLKLGVTYLKHLEELYQGNRVLTLIAYNWGPGKVDRAIRDKKRGVPQEVVNYALKILSDHQKWQRAVFAKADSLVAVS